MEGRNQQLKIMLTMMLNAIGDDSDREGLLETPDRVMKSWHQLYRGYKGNLKDLFKVFTNEGTDQMIICKDIEFYSMCEHHIQPFFGKAHVAYIPGDKIVGLSKLARITDHFARRLQNQERLTDQIASAIEEHLEPKGVGVIMEGKHFCMMSRGVQKQNSSMVTSALKGVFHDDHVKQEFIDLTKGR